jgi:hypothetical protein
MLIALWQRAVEGLGIAIRSLALETLCRITGPAVKQVIYLHIQPLALFLFSG